MHLPKPLAASNISDFHQRWLLHPFQKILAAVLAVLFFMFQWCPNADGQSYKGGYFIYRKPPGSYVQLIEYRRIERSTLHTMSVVLANGTRANLSLPGILATINFPSQAEGLTVEITQMNIDILEGAIAGFPQFKAHLNPLLDQWNNRMQLEVQLQNKSGNTEIAQTTPPMVQEPAHVAIPHPAETHPANIAVTGFHGKTADDAWEYILDGLKKGDVRYLLAFRESHGQAFLSDQMIAEITIELTKVSEALIGIEHAQSEINRIAPEIDRLRRNADVADRPNPLGRDNSSRQNAARSHRNKANELEAAGRRQLDRERNNLNAAIEGMEKLAKAFAESGVYDGALALVEFADMFSIQQGIRRSRSWETREIQSAVLMADVLYRKALAALTEKKDIRAAVYDLDESLKKFPKSRKALALQDRIVDIVSECSKRYDESKRQREAKRYDLALAEIEQIESRMMLTESLAAFKRELLEIMENKGKQLAEARSEEQQRNYEAALRIYETYDNEADIIRVASILADERKELGDPIGAMRYYRLSNQPDKAIELEHTARLQEEEYRNAKALLQSGNPKEALLIYERYHDRSSYRLALIESAKRFEQDGEFDRALEYYTEGHLSEGVERVRVALEEQEKTVAQARRKEDAGDYEAAISLYEEAAAFSDMKKAAKAYGGLLEARQDFNAAVHFYDIAEATTDARRLRETHHIVAYRTRRLAEMSAPEVYEANIGAVVTVFASNFQVLGTGSGFFVERGGWIVTNHHVVDDAVSVKVRLHDGREYEAEVIVAREVPDFALLKIDLPYHSVVKLGMSADVKAGQSVYAIGSPGASSDRSGISGPLEGSITSGIVSQPKRIYSNNTVIQIDAAINHGNSGGPLFSTEGKVIGINTFGLGTADLDVGTVRIGSDIQNINFAIHIDQIKPLIQANVY